MRARLIPWLMFVALMAVLWCIAHLVAQRFGRQYHAYVVVGGMLVAWLALHWHTKRQERLLNEEVANMSESQRISFFENARAQGLLRGGDHES